MVRADSPFTAPEITAEPGAFVIFWLDWFERIRARPSYAKAFYPGSRLSQRAEFESVMAQGRDER